LFTLLALFTLSLEGRNEGSLEGPGPLDPIRDADPGGTPFISGLACALYI
jgi:hypothetical protein